MPALAASAALLAAFYPIAKGSGLSTRDAAAVAALASSAIATNYVLAWLPNVKLMDAIVFSTALLFGLKVGAWTGAMIWAVYGAVNPYGFEPMIWLATIASESIYAAFGALARRAMGRGVGESLALFALMGVMATILYDAATNLACGLIFSLYSGRLEWAAIWLIFLAGIPFSAVHAAGNAIVFPALGAPLARGLSKLLGRDVAHRGREWKGAA
jgi:uncharacterized membrane protein